jgi:Fic family protein
VRRYDYNFIRDLGIPSKTFSALHKVLSVNDNLEQMISSNEILFSKLMEIASIESVKGSNAIEGIASTDERTRGIVLHNTKPIGHDEKAIAGYRDALELIHKDWENLPFDDTTICGLHKTIYSYLEGGGTYKTTDNVIIDRTSEGDKIRWMPVSAKETEENVNSMIAAYMEVSGDPEIEPAILIPCVILDFLCIHPFSDGNGRTSRLLTDLLMYHHGLTVQKYVSIESTINATRDRYYDSLQASSEGWHENKNDYLPFILYFIDILVMSVKELDKRRIAIIPKKNSKTERIEKTVLESLVPISKAEICNILIDISPNTVESVLSKMIKDGKIIRIGTKRSARYRRI